MVKLDKIHASNANLSSLGPGRVAMFVGATSGIGLATMTEYARYADTPKIYIVGRNADRLSQIVADLKKVNDTGTYVPLQGQITLFRNVDAICEGFKRKETSLHLLVMSPGYIKLSRVHDTSDGIEETIALRYYIRMRFIHSLLPCLLQPPTSRIHSIHFAGREGVLDESDMLLQRTYSFPKAGMMTATMNTLALMHIAETYPSISCVHSFPSLVFTEGKAVFTADWPWVLGWLWHSVLMPVMKPFSVTLEQSAAYNLFMSTSARFPAKTAAKETVDAGVAVPEGVDVAHGADWEVGSGCYVMDYDGEMTGKKMLLDDYRGRGYPRKIWEHTQEIFENALRQ